MHESGKTGNATRAKMRRMTLGLLGPAGALTILAILILGAGAASACGTPPSSQPTVLATIPLIDAIAANNTVVYVQGVANCSEIYAITPSGSVSVYATLPLGANVTCDEGALSLVPVYNTTCQNGWGWGGWGSPALRGSEGNWGHGGGNGSGNTSGCTPCQTQVTLIGENLYDIVAGYLFEITENGTNVTLVHHFYVSKAASENLGLTYDQVGTFDHDLIVTSSAGGDVWTYNTTTGSVALLTKLSTYIGGPAVAPTGFGSYGGEVLIAEKRLGEVVAVTASGNVTNVANWSKSNAVAVIPSGGGWGGCGGGQGGCSFGSQHDVIFLANYSSGALEAFPASDFVHLQGDGIVAGGLNQGIGTFTPSGTTSVFASNTERLSYITAITCFNTGNGQHGGWGGW
jgi:hypothetical protein